MSSPTTARRHEARRGAGDPREDTVRVASSAHVADTILPPRMGHDRMEEPGMKAVALSQAASPRAGKTRTRPSPGGRVPEI